MLYLVRILPSLSPTRQLSISSFSLCMTTRNANERSARSHDTHARSPPSPVPAPHLPPRRPQAVRAKWAMKGHQVTFFAAHPGQAGLSNVFLGAYDPSNFNTTDLCAVPAPANAKEGSGEGGGVLLGVAKGEVQLLVDPGDGTRSAPESRALKVATGTVLAPVGRGHAVLPAGRGLAVWYYVHSCPEGLFHLCIGFLSGAGWEQLYPGRVGTRKSWTMEYGVPK